MGTALVTYDLNGNQTIEELPSDEQVIEKLTPKNKQIQRCKRQFTEQDIEDMARLCGCEMMSELDACALLNINDSSWYRFKARGKNNVRYATHIARLRGTIVTKLLRQIDRSALGIGVKQPEWRAAQYRLQVIDREKYGDQRVIPSTVNNTVNTFNQTNLMFNEAAKRIYGQAALSPAQPEVKQVEDAKPAKPK